MKWWEAALVSALSMAAFLALTLWIGALEFRSDDSPTFTPSHLEVRCEEYVTCHVYRVFDDLTCVVIRPGYGAALPGLIDCGDW